MTPEICKKNPCHSESQKRPVVRLGIFCGIGESYILKVSLETHKIPAAPAKNDMGVSKNRGTPKWMVYNGKPIKMDDFGVPLFSETSTLFLMTLLRFPVFCHDLLMAAFGNFSPKKSSSQETALEYSAVVFSSPLGH